MSYPPPRYYAAPPGYPSPQLYVNGATSPDDLDRPLYGATFGQAFKRYWRGYVRFSGRASRSEYWWAMLAVNLILLLPILACYALVLYSVYLLSIDMVSYPSGEPSLPDLTMAFIGYGVIFVICLPFLLPSWACMARRLHDTNRSGWWSLLHLVPFGSYVLLVFAIQAPDPAGVRFDPAVGANAHR